MAKRQKAPKAPLPPEGSGPLTHSPFAQLAGKLDAVVPDPQVGKAPEPGPQASSTASSARPGPTPAAARPRPGKLVLREEKAGRRGKTVTRVLGIPDHEIDGLASQLRKALGCGATREGADLVLLGAVRERAAAWFARDGARVKDVKVPAPTRAPTVAAGPPEPGATVRASVARGRRVAVIQKPHQQTGELTEGVVQALLTSSPTHPRGIKVRLESGVVGRVYRLL